MQTHPAPRAHTQGKSCSLAHAMPVRAVSRVLSTAQAASGLLCLSVIMITIWALLPTPSAALLRTQVDLVHKLLKPAEHWHGVQIEFEITRDTPASILGANLAEFIFAAGTTQRPDAHGLGRLTALLNGVDTVNAIIAGASESQRRCKVVVSAQSMTEKGGVLNASIGSFADPGPPLLLVLAHEGAHCLRNFNELSRQWVGVNTTTNEAYADAYPLVALSANSLISASEVHLLGEWLSGARSSPENAPSWQTQGSVVRAAHAARELYGKRATPEDVDQLALSIAMSALPEWMAKRGLDASKLDAGWVQSIAAMNKQPFEMARH
jgi:hypothetical protein